MILKTLQDRLFINLSNPGLTHNLKRKLKGNTNLLRTALNTELQLSFFSLNFSFLMIVFIT